MDQTKHPGISFDTVLLKELSFTREMEMLVQPKLDLRFKHSYAISPEKNILRYDLSCILKDTKGSFSIFCTMTGVFSIFPGFENMELEFFAQNNAPALLLPYIREIISSTTLKSGIMPLILPPLNIQAMMSEQAPEQPQPEKS